MKQLQKLTIPYIACDKLLEVVGKGCPSLRHLDMPGTSEVTNKGTSKTILPIPISKGLLILGLEKLYHVRISPDYSRPSELSKILMYLNLGGPGGYPPEVEAVARLILNIRGLVCLGGYPFTGEALIKARKITGDECYTSNLR